MDPDLLLFVNKLIVRAGIFVSFILSGFECKMGYCCYLSAFLRKDFLFSFSVLGFFIDCYSLNKSMEQFTIGTLLFIFLLLKLFYLQNI